MLDSEVCDVLYSYSYVIGKKTLVRTRHKMKECNLLCYDYRKDVLVITAQILVNALATGDVQIEAFSLIVFDECHHSHAKHPYNQIMAYYLDLKLEDKHKQLPQVC